MKQPRGKGGKGLALACTAACLAVSSCVSIISPAPDATGLAASGVPLPPAAYYDQNCARCHGSYESFYGPPVQSEPNAERLAERTRALAAETGDVPLALGQPDAQMAYHRGLIDRRPFILLSAFNLNTDTSVSLAGEVTPGARVNITAGPQWAAATVTGHEWRAWLPPGVNMALIRISATKDNLTSELVPERTPYSYSIPLTPGEPAMPPR